MKLTQEALSSSAVSTTTVSKLRGFTLELLERLAFNGHMNTAELNEIYDKGSNYLNSYLYRLKRYGMAYKEGSDWLLTDTGLDCIERLLFYFSISYYSIPNNRTTTQQQQINNTSQSNKPAQVSIQAWLREKSPGDAERAVVDFLVQHFNKTGSKYILAKDHYGLSDMLSINVDMIGDVLAQLRSDHIVYHMRDPTSGWWKLGLMKAFLETLEKVTT